MTFSLENYRLEESRVFRDPVHGYIRVFYSPFWQMINTKEMQRLRRIHQLGGTHQVYQTAEHSRFTHSLGVYEVVRRILELETFEDELNDYERLVVLMAALLHDVGHGPFSHCFEHVFTKYKHEEMTVRIILDASSEVNQVLNNISSDLANDVAAVILKIHPKHLLVELVSSQIDGDRMDYLLRDSYFSGTAYGRFDIERIMRTLRVHKGSIVVKESGIQAIENYILARYHMYWQVYYHPVTRCYEQILLAIFRRLSYLFKNGYEFKTELDFLLPLLRDDDIDVSSYLRLDENVIMYYFMRLEEEKDMILKDLCRRFLNRDLFKDATIKDVDTYEKIKADVLRKGYDLDYYFLSDEPSALPYIHMDATSEVEEIKILMADGEVKVLPEVSEIVRAIVESKIRKTDRKIYYPR